MPVIKHSSGYDESYACGGSYNIFGDKDTSKALEMDSLQPEDVIVDYNIFDNNTKVMKR
ncbi:22321_t:CDS:2 [Entrophospora sp. SA101]|nr:8630_t:CDS:2 [Entrophospora sp. SA101]CAJ0767633.1 22321_t:CDS:2 [Entrophospora sp. SA101]